MSKKSLAPLVLALLPLWASAQTSSGAFDRFMALTTGANTQTIGFASGTPILTDTHSTGANLGNLNVARDLESKGLLVAGSAKLPIGTAGRIVPVAVTGKVSAATLGKAFGALGSLAGGWPGVALMVGTPFLMQWLSTAGVSVNPDGTLGKLNPSACTSNCYFWRSPLPDGSYTSFVQSPQTACDAALPAWISYFGGRVTGSVSAVDQIPSNPGLAFSCIGTLDGGGGRSLYSLARGASRSADASSMIPATLPEVQAQLSTVQPDPWVLSELYNKAVLDNKIDLNIVAHGPSTVEGPAVTTVEPATATTPEKTTTTKTNYTCGYVLADVSCMEQKSKSSQQTGIDPATGQPYPKVELGTTAKEAAPKTEPAKDTCGLPGTPACKMDETGTPEPYASTKYKQVADDYKVQVDAARETVAGTADKGFLSGWSVFFSAPAVAACQPIVLPNGMGGASMGTLDPCPVVDGVRAVMAYIWALGGFWLCLGMVKRTF